MKETLLILILIACLIYTVWKHFKPKIEIIVLVKHYRVYLWYDKWEGANYQGRTYKYLFTI